jgi:hypothetical protein
MKKHVPSFLLNQQIQPREKPLTRLDVAIQIVLGLVVLAMMFATAWVMMFL